MKQKIIFIVGSPRSGTHLLGSSILMNLDCRYINEISDFWGQYSNYKSDCINENNFSKEFIRNIRDTYLKKFVKESNKEFIIEKTASNSLRIGFLNKVFPEANFIHIIRNGKDVAVSIRKKALGDGRKETQFTENTDTYSQKLEFLIKEIKRKIKSGTSIKSIIFNLRKNINFILMHLKIKKKLLWGTNYPGVKYQFKNLSLIEFAALQWQTNVLTIKNSLSILNQEKYIEFKYEDLLNNPNKVLKKILYFITNKNIEENKISHNIKPVATYPRLKLNTLENSLIDSKVGFILKVLNYE